MLVLFFLLLYGGFCVWFAKVNYVWIYEQKKVKHFWNGLVHLTASAIAYYFFGWRAAMAILLIARLVFDVALNLFRGMGIDYVSPKPKSIVDKIEKKLFKQDSITPKIIYLAALLCLVTIR